jgi:hypothetical protein
MSTGNMRRAQLVTPFGVGAMSVLVNGTSVITAGIDHWYPSPGENSNFELSEFVEHDWRLQERLSVAAFRLPPDHRQNSGQGDQRNRGLKVPVLRFPRWNFCPYCKRIEQSTLTMRQAERCKDKSHGDVAYKPRMTQVPFVAICANGHIDDFPFRGWVHHSLHPECLGVLRLKSSGGGGLEGQTVNCDGCGKSRSLRGITDSRTENGDEHTTLTDRLVGGGESYECPGARPWLGLEVGPCGLPIRGALRGSGNVYFPKVQSSIYVPIEEGAVSAEVHDLLGHPSVDGALTALYLAFGSDLGAKMLRDVLTRSVPPELFLPVSDVELLSAYRDRFGIGAEAIQSLSDDGRGADFLTADEVWRLPEFRAIRETPTDSRLAASDPGIDPTLAPFFERVRSVDVLRETRALYGFTRVRDDVLRVPTGKALLRRTTLPPTQDWLPAYVVKGEGIYLEFETTALEAWEQRPEVNARAGLIQSRFQISAARRGLQPRDLSPRFLMLHTFAHVLINELIFTCGYSSASLRERLYVSHGQGADMAAVLIYTAAGDSEGTMGGLVRMSRPENLLPVVQSAVSDARWCSTDPVCMDAGEKGQGVNSCNGAACHGCALLPETSCEEYNQFLDRGLLIGTFGAPGMGYFSSL